MAGEEVAAETEQNGFKELWLLLLKEPKELTNEEVACLLKHEWDVRERVTAVFRRFPREVEKVRRCRVRKEELSALPTKKLKTIVDFSRKERRGARAENDDEDLDDFFSEPPAEDSDEHIANEIIGEREKAVAEAQG